jgi:hypothetical protein
LVWEDNVQQFSRNVVLLPSQTITASGTTGAIVIPEGYNAVNIYYNVGTPGGTTETLDMYIQQGWKALTSADTTIGVDQTATTYTIWDDYLHFAQNTTSAGVQVARILYGTGTSAANGPSATIGAASDAALAVSKVQAGDIGTVWRLKWVVTGTLPTYPTTWMIGQFIATS